MLIRNARHALHAGADHGHDTDVVHRPDAVNVPPRQLQLERGAVLRDKPRQWHRQIESHAHLPAAVVLEPVELLVGLVAPFTRENLQVFQGWRIDWGKAIAAIHAAGRVDEPLARNHRLGKVIAKALERARFDSFHIGHERRYSVVQRRGCGDEGGFER